ncbi:cadherin-87A-like, partial [Mercenaria mercenaria]|uniref:cadherin-87A-like n=1 Tax=Mercenaria mercenaria TaxID=6596 RepID=UPI00234E5EC2
MDLLSRKRIFIFVVLVGFTQATSPYIKDPGPGYTSITEDFSGTICRFHIVDTDQGDIITVKPADDFTVQYFNIVTNGGTNDVWVNVTVKKPLDRETLGGMVKINLVILDTQHDEVKYDHTVYISDVNDNRPELQDLPYTLDINEQPCNRTTVYTNIHAIDKDSGVNGKVGYSMTPKAQSQESRKKYSETFSIDPKTGSVSLNQCLDYESNSYYQFIVTAKDFGPNGGLNSTAEFIIRVQDVQDKPPFFTGIPYRADIDENSAKGTLIVQIHAEDGDPGVSNNVNYTITDSTCGDVFHVDSFSGDITTSGNIDLDAGKVKNESGNCIITVLAEEIESAGEEQYGNTTASTHITVSVQDVDDNLPSFGKSSYHATVPENTPNGVPLSLNETVSVNDIDQANNARMKITLEYPNHSSCEDFTASPPVVQGFGEILILVKNTSLLDYEKIQNIVIK